MAQSSLLSPSPQPGEVTRESLASHVQAEIARTAGPQLPCYQAETILNGFFDRFGAADGMAICEQAFTVHGGIWQHAPVTVLRFQESHDDFFACPLLAEARGVPQADG